MGDRGSIPDRGRVSSLQHRVQTGSEGHPVSSRMYVGVKQPGNDADNSPSSSADVRSSWSGTSTPPYILIAWR
jgi:hypothetical protein